MKLAMKLAVVAVLLTLAVAAFAGNTANITLYNDSVLNGAKLKAGDYKVTIEGSGPEVKVTFSQGGQKVTAPGTLAQAATRPNSDSVVLSKGTDGLLITELHLTTLKNNYVKF